MPRRVDHDDAEAVDAKVAGGRSGASVAWRRAAGDVVPPGHHGRHHGELVDPSFDPPPRAVWGEMTLDHEAPRWCSVRRCDRWEAGPSCVRERSRCRSPVETPRTPPRRRVALARRRARCHGGGGRFAAASSQQSRAKEGEAACNRRGVGPTIAHGGLQGAPGHGPARRGTAAARGRTTGANVRRFAPRRMRCVLSCRSVPS